MHCTHCGSAELDEGIFWVNPGSRAAGDTGTWYSGPNDLTVFGNPRKVKERRHGFPTVHRCRVCGHLEWFVVKLEGRPEY